MEYNKELELCQIYSTNAGAILLSKAQVRGNYKAELVQRQNKEIM